MLRSMTPPDALSPTRQVQRLAEQHHQRPGHADATPGCPLCIDDGRETAATEVLRDCNPGDWHIVSSFTVRYLLAADDLRRLA